MIILRFSPKAISQYVIPFTMKHFVDIKTLYPFIYILNTNKTITTKYDTHPKRKPPVIFIFNPVEKEDVSVPIHQIHIPKEIESQKLKSK